MAGDGLLTKAGEGEEETENREGSYKNCNNTNNIITATTTNFSFYFEDITTFGSGCSVLCGEEVDVQLPARLTSMQVHVLESSFLSPYRQAKVCVYTTPESQRTAGCSGDERAGHGRR